MGLAIDPSTPAIVVNSNNSVATVATASFSPPAGSILVVRWGGNTVASSNPAAPSITDNLSVHLNWQLLDWQSRADSPTVNGQAATWWAPVGAGGAMTVTVTTGTIAGAQQAVILCEVLTGQAANPIGTHGKSGTGLGSSAAQTYLAQASGGQGFIGVLDWDATGNMTAGTGCTLASPDGTGTIPTQISYGFIRRTLADDISGVNNTLNVTFGGSATNVSWVYVEILPAVETGKQATNRHPGRAPGIRFFQTPRPTDVVAAGGNVVNIDGSLTVTATTSATIAITHTVGGSLTVTANRTATVAVTHTIGGTRVTTVNRTATVAVTHTIGGSRPITVGLSATVAVTHTIGGSRPITVNRVATVAVTHVVAGTRPITVTLTASIITGKDISGSRPTTVNRTASIAITHTIGGSLSVVCVRSADASTGGGFAQFLPFF